MIDLMLRKIADFNPGLVSRVPDAGVISPASILIKLDLPAPFGPPSNSDTFFGG